MLVLVAQYVLSLSEIRYALSELFLLATDFLHNIVVRGDYVSSCVYPGKTRFSDNLNVVAEACYLALNLNAEEIGKLVKE